MCTLGEDDVKSPASSSGVPLHVKLVLEWDMPAKTQVINDDTDQVEEHSSVKQVLFSFVINRLRLLGVYNLDQPHLLILTFFVG